MIREQPFAQGNVAVLEDRAHGHGELLTAPSAFPDAVANVRILLGRLRPERIGVIDHPAMWPDRAIRPAQFFNILPRGILIAKVLSQSD